MLNLAIGSVSSFNQNGTEKLSIQTPEGVVFCQRDYFERKCKSLGLSAQSVLGNAVAYNIVIEKPVIRKEGVAFKYTDKAGVEKESTPKLTYIEGSFNLQLSSAGSLNAMIADKIGAMFAAQYGLNAVAGTPAKVTTTAVEELPEIILDEDQVS